MPERFRGELLTVGRYTNPASFTFTCCSLFFPVPVLNMKFVILYPRRHVRPKNLVSLFDIPSPGIPAYCC